jgi:hypothetical protein
MFSVFITGAQFLTWSLGRGGARQTRRWRTRISVGGRPPAGGPSGAGLPRGARVPGGLVTPSRGTPERGRAPSEGMRCGSTPGRWGPARVSQGPLWRWPPDRRAVPWRWPPRRDARVAPGRSACGRVGRAVRAPASGSLGRRWDAALGVVARGDGRAQDHGPPRRLRRGRVAPGGSPSGGARPDAAAPPGRMPRGGRPTSRRRGLGGATRVSSPRAAMRGAATVKGTPLQA